jgi:putative ATPase
LRDVANGASEEPPMHIRNAPHPKMKEHGYGDGYKYPHNFPGHVVEQEYLPESLRGREYYKPDYDKIEEPPDEGKKDSGEQGGGKGK